MRMEPNKQPQEKYPLLNNPVFVIGGIVVLSFLALWFLPSSASSPNPPTSASPTRELSPQEYAQMTRAEYEWYLRNESGLTEQGIEGSLANFEFNQGQLRRWHERETHWASVDDFNAYVNRAMADGVMSLDEFTDACITHPQWESKLQAARDYVIEFRRFDPETVELNNLSAIQQQAENGLQTLAETKKICAEQGLG